MWGEDALTIQHIRQQRCKDEYFGGNGAQVHCNEMVKSYTIN